MAPKEPTKHQLSSRLQYEQKTPAFLQKLQRRIAGGEDSEDEDEYYNDGSGRPPIPQRPAIPERPRDDPGSADEDEDFIDERPQVVVLKVGKHLTEREAENERRKEKGLPPLPEPEVISSKDDKSTRSEKTKPKDKAPSLSFSSGKGTISSKGKRKIIGDAEDNEDKDTDKKPTKKKAKKAVKSLLSFGEDV